MLTFPLINVMKGRLKIKGEFLYPCTCIGSKNLKHMVFSCALKMDVAFRFMNDLHINNLDENAVFQMDSK